MAKTRILEGIPTVEQMTIEWLDTGKQPQCKPDPDYPHGKDVDISFGAKRNCRIALPYPAQRIGCYIVRCHFCGFSVGLTTAGRPDDPRSVTMPCAITGRAQ